MRVMVLGASGQLGRHLCAQLGADAISITRAQLDFNAENAAEIFQQLLDKHTPDAVCNAAAYTNVAGAQTNEAEAMRCNAHMPEMIAKACARAGMPLLHGSTDYVFDGRKGAPYSEADVTAPLNIYGKSKLAGEQAVMLAYPAAIIARYSWLYDHAGAGFFVTMRKLAAKQSRLRIVADQIGAPTYAADAARMSLALLSANAKGLVHVASSGHTSWHGFACAVLSDMPTRITPILASEYTASVPRPTDSRLATKRLTKWGIKSPHWHEGIAACKGAMNAN